MFVVDPMTVIKDRAEQTLQLSYSERRIGQHTTKGNGSGTATRNRSLQIRSSLLQASVSCWVALLPCLTASSPCWCPDPLHPPLPSLVPYWVWERAQCTCLHLNDTLSVFHQIPEGREEGREKEMVKVKIERKHHCNKNSY